MICKGGDWGDGGGEECEILSAYLPVFLSLSKDEKFEFMMKNALDATTGKRRGS